MTPAHRLSLTPELEEGDVAAHAPSRSANESPPGGDRLLLTPTEAARALGIGKSLTYELMGVGRLPFVRIGAVRRIPIEAVRRFIQIELQRQGFSA